MNTMLIIRTTPSDAEFVSLLLFDGGALAVGEHESPDDGETELHAGFESAEAATTMMSALAPRSMRVVAVEPDWIESQREGLRPLELGPWHIRTPWHDPVGPGIDLIDLIIDPGAAFGHGRHPTSRLVLEELHTSELDGRRVLDVGTGTGVLAIAAATLGATVDACDLSDVAIAQARANIATNALSDRVSLESGPVTPELAAVADLAVVNVTIDQHRFIADDLQDVDVVVLSGILARQVDRARSLYPRHTTARETMRDEWVCLRLERSG
ncbi:MAG: methyltransferase [Acidimicrobiales bacterium]|nr:methyltransferase [Acidimicrobiales bacterium]